MLSAPEVWFVTGSQHLYGPETLDQVAAARAGRSPRRSTRRPAIAVRVVFKPVLTTPDEIRATLPRRPTPTPRASG